MLLRIIGPLKALLVVVIAGALGVELLIPLAAAETADYNPNFAYLAVPYSIALIAIVACCQVAATAIWPLLSQVGNESIFTTDAFRWVKVIIYAGGAATVISAALTTHELIFVGEGPITVPLGLIGITAGAGAFTLLMLVMRELLRSAVIMRANLDEVI